MRTVINRSISFDPQLFAKMEERRGRLLMQRSEYITRCVLRDMMAGGDMTIGEVPDNIVSKPSVMKDRKRRPKK
jgi:hypothetical protein